MKFVFIPCANIKQGHLCRAVTLVKNLQYQYVKNARCNINIPALLINARKREKEIEKEMKKEKEIETLF